MSFVVFCMPGRSYEIHTACGADACGMPCTLRNISVCMAQHMQQISGSSCELQVVGNIVCSAGCICGSRDWWRLQRLQRLHKSSRGDVNLTALRRSRVWSRLRRRCGMSSRRTQRRLARPRACLSARRSARFRQPPRSAAPPGTPTPSTWTTAPVSVFMRVVIRLD